MSDDGAQRGMRASIMIRALMNLSKATESGDADLLELETIAYLSLSLLLPMNVNYDGITAHVTCHLVSPELTPIILHGFPRIREGC